MWTEDIVRMRDAGMVRCCFGSFFGCDLDAVARRFGLQLIGDQWQQVDVERAINIVEALLWKDLAYHSEIMPREQARVLAVEFVSSFAEGATRYFTNGPWDNFHESTAFSWEPCTEATFDGGVIAIGNEVSGCVWVEDED